MLKWERNDQFDSIFDKATFGAGNTITVYKFSSRSYFQMWFHIGEEWVLSNQLEAKNFEDAHAEAVFIVREYLSEKQSYWMDLFHDLWKADQWLDEENDE